MERKRMGRLLAAFAVALVAALGLVLGASARAYAITGVRWTEDQVFNEDTTIDDYVIVEKDITVTIAEGKTLTVNKGIFAEECTLTFKGSGIVSIHGENGKDGAYGESQGGNGSNGYYGILGDVIVDGPTVTCVGGSGGQGGGADKAQDLSIGGNGGNGAPAIDGSLTVLGGNVKLIGGAGGNYGEGRYNGSFGSDSKAISDTVTADVIEASSDGERYDTLRSPANTEARFVNATTEVEPEPGPEPAEGQDMFRLYNPYSGEHFYTASAFEHDVLVGLGWQDEGVGWAAPAEGTPVFRLYNPYAGDHHYTMSAFERDALVKAGWLDEGIGWRSAGENGVAVLRQYNPYATTGTHNYTTSAFEAESLVGLGWQDEGIAWYAL